MENQDRLLALVQQAKTVASQYRKLTGKSLGITGEVAELEAIRCIPELELAPVRQAGYDAIGRENNLKYQIKSRCLPPNSKRTGRIGAIDKLKEFDFVLLVILDEEFNALEIHQADRAAVIAELMRPGSKSRNERGALGIRAFIRIGHCVWRRTDESRPQRSQQRTPQAEVSALN